MQGVIFDDIVSGFYRAANGRIDWRFALQPFQRALGVFAIHPHRPLAMLLVQAPGRRLQLDPFVVAAAYDPTPAEARVAVNAATGASADEIAARHGVSPHTVRSQLRVVFEKPGAVRQAELVSLLSTLPTAAMPAAQPLSDSERRR